MNYFVANTPFQLKYALEISKSFDDQPSLIVSTTQFSNEISSDDLIEILFQPKTGGIKSKLKFLLNARRRLLNTSSGNRYFISHIDTFLANTIWNRVDSAKNEIYFYYEGALYLDPGYQERMTSRNYKRKIGLWIADFPRLPSRRIYIPEDPKVSGIIVPDKRLINKGVETKQIVIPQKYPKFFSESGGSLFLTQPQPNISIDEYLTLLKKAITAFTSDSEISATYIKLHHADSENIAEHIGSHFPEIKFMEKLAPIEGSVSEIKPRRIASFYSSALLNLNLIDPKVELISYVDPSTEREDNQYRIIKSKFEELGIEFRYI